MDDLAIVERQLGRPPRAFRRVAVRCPFGLPAVAEQRPFDDAGTPFPTQFWLTCPHLVAQLSRLEAGGGVARWTQAAEDDAELAREPRAARTPSSGGSGRSCRSGSAARAAPAASSACTPTPRSRSPGRATSSATRILAEAEPLWPRDGCCTSL